MTRLGAAQEIRALFVSPEDPAATRDKKLLTRCVKVGSNFVLLLENTKCSENERTLKQYERSLLQAQTNGHEDGQPCVRHFHLIQRKAFKPISSTLGEINQNNISNISKKNCRRHRLECFVLDFDPRSKMTLYFVLMLQ